MISHAMATTEEFSFPTTTDLYPCGIDSPQLWHLSPAASPDVFLDREAKECSTIEVEEEEKEEEEGEKADCFPDRPDKHEERKRFSKSDKGSKMFNKVVEENEEEKMDLLWEDFNEELPRSRSSSSSGDVVELGCAQALKLSKNNAAMFSPRPGMLVFMKIVQLRATKNGLIKVNIET